MLPYSYRIIYRLTQINLNIWETTERRLSFWKYGILASATDLIPHELPGRPPHTWAELSAGGRTHVLCDSTGRGLWESREWSPLDCTGFAFCPFAVISHDSEDDHTVAVLVNQRVWAGGVLEPPNTAGQRFYNGTLMTDVTCEWTNMEMIKRHDSKTGLRT